MQTLSISVATADMPAPDSGTVFGIGVRTAYVSSRDLSPIRQLRDTLRQIQFAILRAESPDTENALKERARPVALRLQQALRDERLGWTVEAAAAAALDFPGDVAQNGKLSRWALWLTSGYRLPKQKLDLLMVVRLTRDVRVPLEQHFLDLGGRVLVSQGDNLAFSVEYVFRNMTVAGSSRHTYQVSAVIDYRLRDNLYVNATIGRGPDEKGPGTARFQTHVGVEFGRGPLPLLK